MIVKWYLENARCNPDIVRFILDSENGIITIERMLRDYLDNMSTDEMEIKIKLSDDCKYVQKEWYKDVYINQLSSVKSEINRYSETHSLGDYYGNLISQIDEAISCIKKTSNADRVRVRGHLNMILEYIPHLDMKYELELILRRAIRNIENALADRAGEYDDRTKTITLYQQVLGNIEEDSAAWLCTLAHEVFHAYHYWCAEGSDLTGANANGKIVKESMAAFFEMEYANWLSREISIQRAYSFERIIRSRKEEWELNDMHSWPYAGAKHIDDKTVLRQLFHFSLRNIDDAFEVLIKFKNHWLG